MHRSLTRGFCGILSALVLAFLAGKMATADDSVSETRSKEQSSEESRQELKTLNDHFPFEVPETARQWRERRKDLRTRVMVATGLWPMPSKPELNATIHSRIEGDGFTTEKVYFESLPGHFVTGMLFRPAPNNSFGLKQGMRPGVLSPHGHGGRLMRLDDDEIAEQLKSGGEVHEASGRYPKLARCVHLARMGCVTFIFDMLGYGDSQQISYQTAHRHKDSRPEESQLEDPVFYSIEAELRLQSIMGLQTWNAIRCLDFLESLPDVDPQRLGVTGGSGGGTQTILLGAIDNRVQVSFPNGMVSTSMQGGCYCENSNYLRIGTGNVELAALFAPKPQGMTAADDWTRDMMTDGFPELQELYKLLNAPENVMCRPLLHFPHNYNYVTRATMYPWMAKHLELPDDVPLIERDFKPLSDAEMRVWDEQHPAPETTGVDHEREVLSWWKKQNQTALKNSDDRVRLAAWRVIMDDGLESNASQEPPDWLTVSEQDGNMVLSSTADASEMGEQPTVSGERSYAGFTFGYNPPLVARRASELARYLRHLTASNPDTEVQVHATGAAAAWGAGAAALLSADASESLVRFVIDPQDFRFDQVDSYRDAMFVPGASKYGGISGLLSLAGSR